MVIFAVKVQHNEWFCCSQKGGVYLCFCLRGVFDSHGSTSKHFLRKDWMLFETFCDGKMDSSIYRVNIFALFFLVWIAQSLKLIFVRLFLMMVSTTRLFLFISLHGMFIILFLKETFFGSFQTWMLFGKPGWSSDLEHQV